MQTTTYANVDPTVHVYAEDGPDLRDYLQKLASHNARPADPTSWKTVVHAGADFLDRFVADRAGDVAVVAGNNRRKIEYLTRAIEAGMNVLADKPMAIDAAGFETVRNAFALAHGDQSRAIREGVAESWQPVLDIARELATPAA